MQLSPVQHDALVELLNIGFGKAGASLSKLTGQRVVLDVPHVAVHPLDQLNAALSDLVTGDVASVHQVFTGPVAGDAMLLLDPAGAAILKELLTDEPLRITRDNNTSRLGSFDVYGRRALLDFTFKF
jgi:chemotaxis protein CheC